MDDDMALKAICQDIDQRFLDFGNETNKFFENDANDPNKVFYEDKSTYDKFYQDGITNIQVNTIDKVKNPRVQEAARLYFNQKKMAAGQNFLVAYDENKKNAEALVFGRELDDKVQKAIGAKWDEDINLYKDDIAKTVNDMASHGMIRKDQIEDTIKDAGQKIEYGRAINVIPSLDYTTGKKFLAEITTKKDLDDKTRKAINDYFNEYWKHQADIENKAQADRYADFLHNPEKITPEAVQGAFPQNPPIGVSNSYEQTLLGIKDKRDAHDREMKQNAQIEFYFQQLHNPESPMYGKLDEIKKNVLDDPDLTTAQKEHIIKSIEGGKGAKSSAEIEWGDDYYEYHMAEYYEILTSEDAVPEEKEKLYGEFCKRYYVPPEKYNSLLNNLKNAYVNPRLKSLVTMFDNGMQDAAKKKDYAKYDKYKAAANSLYETLFTDMSNPDGTPMAKPEKDRKIDLALDMAQKFLDGERLDELASQQFLPNNPVFIAKEDGDYDIDVGADWTTLRDVAERASLLRYTDEGGAVLDQFKAMCSKMISGATGEYKELGNPIFKGDEVRFEAGVRYYKDQDGKTRRYVNKVYTIKLNKNGNVNIFETRHDGEGEVTDLAVPYIVKRQWGVEAEENAAFKAYQQDVRTKQNAGIDVEKANRAYEEAPDEYKTGMVKVEHERLNR